MVADKHPIRRPNIGRNKIPLVRADAADGWPAPESANNCESGAPSVGPVAVTIGKAAVASS